MLVTGLDAILVNQFFSDNAFEKDSRGNMIEAECSWRELSELYLDYTRITKGLGLTFCSASRSLWHFVDRVSILESGIGATQVREAVVPDDSSS